MKNMQVTTKCTYKQKGLLTMREFIWVLSWINEPQGTEKHHCPQKIVMSQHKFFLFFSSCSNIKLKGAVTFDHL